MTTPASPTRSTSPPSRFASHQPLLAQTLTQFVGQLSQHLKPQHRATTSWLHGSADALLCAELALKAIAGNPAQPLAIITASAQDAQRLYEEIRYFANGLRLCILPDWETLPYDTFSPHQDLISERLATLYQIQQHDVDVVLIPATTALYRLAPPTFLAQYTFLLTQKERLNEAKFKEQLLLAGYNHVSQVMSPGEYCIRGGIIDLFAMGSVLPFRIELFDDEIDSIRTFDPDTQRTVYPVSQIRLLPGREFPMDEAARTGFRSRFRATFEGDPTKSSIYKDMGNGIAGAGIEYYLPLFFEQTATIFDYLPSNTLLVTHGALEPVFQQFWQDTQERYRYLAHDAVRPLLPPEQLFLTSEQFFVAAKPLAQLALQRANVNANINEPSGSSTAANQTTPSDTTVSTQLVATGLTQAIPMIGIDRKAEDPLAQFRALAQHYQQQGFTVMVVAESAGRCETLSQYFANYQLPLPVIEALNLTDTGTIAPATICLTYPQSPDAFHPTSLSSGFIVPAAKLMIVTETELFQQGIRQPRRHKKDRATNSDMLIRDLSELSIGSPVVHQQHGIGRYLGLQMMDLGNGATEFLHLEYANQATLYVPVADLQLISRYTGASDENAPLHTLGSGQWEKSKQRAAKMARDTAAELLNMYARRAARQGHAFEYSAVDYENFVAGFGFDETVDQQAAIDAVIQDMTSGKPMDRLVCGDVGFGKTEVALRAACIGVMGGKQVAVLAPTTLLAEQHYLTFSDRFADLPVQIAELSRFKTTKEINQAIAGINAGTIDIVIGTHKLLSKDIQFKNLGLVIIDEEHRFGVRQKEAFKALRAEVDILTMTATPIPRTLGMAMEGIRDFSVIATAPQKRLAIKTFVRQESDSVIREAMLRELKRGGQVFFLHNEVETIENRKMKLEQLIPEARIAVAHGQMNERDLEKVMRDFYHQRCNVLLCTTIIETGIDVPSANTIIMHRADRFGLAQLHQLRGRVGRSHHQAYAYLLVHSEEALTKQAQQRLHAITQMEELGSGFYLAMQDLEIRGAGEVLGDSQSGNMQEVGLSLYSKMLNQAVKALKNGELPDLAQPLEATVEINLHLPALLPSDYCGDVQERLVIYKRLANCSDDRQIDEIQEGLVDRFGKLPDATRTLIETHRLRLFAEPIGIQKIDANDSQITLQFTNKPNIDFNRVVQLLQKDRNVKMAGQDKLKITAPLPTLQHRISKIHSVVGLITH